MPTVLLFLSCAERHQLQAAVKGTCCRFAGGWQKESLAWHAFVGRGWYMGMVEVAAEQGDGHRVWCY